MISSRSQIPIARPALKGTDACHKPRLLVVSHVLPFPRNAGQHQRVFYTLQAARQFFHVTFATNVADRDRDRVKEQLLTVCDQVILLPSEYSKGTARKALHRVTGELYALRTGLKLSNYVIGKLEFSPQRVESHLVSGEYDCVMFEYWHAADSAIAFRRRGVPCVLDMHNILWQAYARQQDSKSFVPEWWKRRRVLKYKAEEEASWKCFDGLVAINQEEMKYTVPRVPETTKVFHAAMGTDLTTWPYSWQPAEPLRIAYYGGLRTPHNQQDALKCLTNIMPAVWHEFPEAELWLVGSNPPESLRALTADPRVKVTGYVEDVQDILRKMSVVACPWTGTYGFRSRLIEVMALGVPLVASRDAVWGMGLDESSGISIAEGDDEMTAKVLRLLKDKRFASEESSRSRQAVEQLFSVDNTYGKLVHDLKRWLQVRSRKTV